MRDLLSPLALLAAAALAAPALAQDTAETEAPATEAAPAEELPLGQPDAQAPQAYVKETFKDWRVICVKLGEQAESCNMQQLMTDAEGNPVSQVSIAPLPPEAKPRAAAVEIATPLETLLSEDLRLSVDSASAKRYRFSFCSPQACYSRFALTDEDVAAFKAGSEAKVQIVPLAAPDQTATIVMSLAGFTAAYDLVGELMPK